LRARLKRRPDRFGARPHFPSRSTRETSDPTLPVTSFYSFHPVLLPWDTTRVPPHRSTLFDHYHKTTEPVTGSPSFYHIVYPVIHRAGDSEVGQRVISPWLYGRSVEIGLDLFTVRLFGGKRNETRRGVQFEGDSILKWASTGPTIRLQYREAVDFLIIRYISQLESGRQPLEKPTREGRYQHREKGSREKTRAVKTSCAPLLPPTISSAQSLAVGELSI